MKRAMRSLLERLRNFLDNLADAVDELIHEMFGGPTPRP